jgi:hypothetical protein
MNFLSPFSFSESKVYALIFKHKAILLDEVKDEEKTAGILTWLIVSLESFEALFKLPPEKDDPGRIINFLLFFVKLQFN